MKQLHERIKEIRLSRKINQSELAVNLGISRNAYVQIENGVTKSISISVGKALAKELDISFNELFEIENSEFEKTRIELTKEIEKLKSEYQKEYNQLVLSRDLYKDRLEVSIEKLNGMESMKAINNKEFTMLYTKIAIHEALHFLDKDLFAAKFPEIVKNLVLNTVYESEVVDRFYYLFDHHSIDEIFMYIDIERFENNIAFTKFCSKFEAIDLDIDRKEFIKQIKETQTLLRKELNL